MLLLLVLTSKWDRQWVTRDTVDRLLATARIANADATDDFAWMWRRPRAGQRLGFQMHGNHGTDPIDRARFWLLPWPKILVQTKSARDAVATGDLYGTPNAWRFGDVQTVCARETAEPRDRNSCDGEGFSV
jgi:hypothetical protein